MLKPVVAPQSRSNTTARNRLSGDEALASTLFAQAESGTKAMLTVITAAETSARPMATAPGRDHLDPGHQSGA